MRFKTAREVEALFWPVMRFLSMITWTESGGEAFVGSIKKVRERKKARKRRNSTVIVASVVVNKVFDDNRKLWEIRES